MPLLSNERVTFHVDGVPYTFAEGEAVEVNNMGVHAVTNEGDGDRIHLIFEYYDAAARSRLDTRAAARAAGVTGSPPDRGRL